MLGLNMSIRLYVYSLGRVRLQEHRFKAGIITLRLHSKIGGAGHADFECEPERQLHRCCELQLFI